MYRITLDLPSPPVVAAATKHHGADTFNRLQDANTGRFCLNPLKSLILCHANLLLPSLVSYSFPFNFWFVLFLLSLLSMGDTCCGAISCFQRIVALKFGTRHWSFAQAEMIYT